MISLASINNPKQERERERENKFHLDEFYRQITL